LQLRILERQFQISKGCLMLISNNGSVRSQTMILMRLTPTTPLEMRLKNCCRLRRKLTLMAKFPTPLHGFHFLMLCRPCRVDTAMTAAAVILMVTATPMTLLQPIIMVVQASARRMIILFLPRSPQVLAVGVVWLEFPPLSSVGNSPVFLNRRLRSRLCWALHSRHP